MAEAYKFDGTVVWIDKLTGDVRAARNTVIKFVDAETGAPVKVSVNGGTTTDQDTVTTDELAGFTFWKASLAPVHPVVGGNVVIGVTVGAVNADRLMRQDVDSAVRLAQQTLDLATRAEAAAARSEAYAADATKVSGQAGVLLVDGSDTPVTVYANPANPAALPNGSLVLMDSTEVVVNPAPPVVTTDTASSASGLPWLSGAYTPTVADATAFETMRGTPLDLFYVKAPVDTWANIQNTGAWLTRPRTSTRVAAQVPLWPANGTVTAAAGGSDVAQWTQLAKALRSGDAIVLGREMNLKSVHWAATDTNAADWRAAWTKAYDAIKAANPGVTVIWAPDAGQGSTITDVRTVFVDGKVDVIGLVTWDWWPTDNSDSAWQQLRSGDTYRLDGWLQFAKARGLKLALIEWALVWASPGGQDNPRWIAHVLDWCRQNAPSIWGEVYHSTAADGRGSVLTTASNPTSVLTYRAWMDALKAGGVTSSTVVGLASQTTTTSVTLTWQPAVAPTGKTVTGYNVYAGTATTPVATNQTGTSYTASGLKGATDYTYRVAPVMSDWTIGPAVTVTARTVDSTTPAEAPDGPRADGIYYTGLIPLQRYNRLNVRVDSTSVPLHPQSAALVTQFQKRMLGNLGQCIMLNTENFNTAHYVATKSTPRVEVKYVGDFPSVEWDTVIGHQVPIDPTWNAAEGTDKHISIYLPESEGAAPGGELWEFWVFNRVNGVAQAEHGGYRPNLANQEGFFDWPWGVSAAGLMQPASCLNLAEARGERPINHAIYIGLGMAKPGNVWPANRDDGWSGADPNDPLEGMRFRFPPDLDLNAYDMAPLARILARAIQKYGLIAADKTGNQHAVPVESGYAEKLRTGVDPWPGLLGSYANSEVLAGLPVEKLQVIDPAWGKAQVDSWTAQGQAAGLPGGANW